MRVGVHFGAERHELDVDDARLVIACEGPTGLSATEAQQALTEALQTPLAYPPLDQNVVPGDKVVLATGADLQSLKSIIGPIAQALEKGGIERGDLTLLYPEATTSYDEEGQSDAGGLLRSVHEPDDAAQIAYLASTKDGERVYLNRQLTDADVVLPVELGRADPRLGLSGPWSLIYPGLSRRETLRELARRDVPPGTSGAPSTDALEVSWLLGCRFQIVVEPGVEGPAGFLAGETEAVGRALAETVARAWTCRASREADLVLAGVGVGWKETSLDDLARGLRNAAALVRRGGKIVALTRASGVMGPAVRHLASQDRAGGGRFSLKGLEEAPDYALARDMAEAMAQADIYLLSDLDPEMVEDLGMIPLARADLSTRLRTGRRVGGRVEPGRVVRDLGI